MVHSNTELLTDYWRARVPPFGAPPRASIDPTEFLDLVPQVFILGRDLPGRYPFRLAGEFVRKLHGRDLRQHDFLSLWRPRDHTALQLGMEGAARRSHPLVLHALGDPSASGAAQLEILLAPLAAPDGAVTRYLGLLQPLTRLADAPLGPLALQHIGLAVGGDILPETPRLRLASVDGRLIA